MANDVSINMRIFISSPGDLTAERAALVAAINKLNVTPQFRQRVKFIPMYWEEETPAQTGDDPQQIVDRRMGGPDEAEIFVCMLRQRMGSPTDVLNPATGMTFQSGTEYEFYTAYAAYQRTKRPLMLLYRCERPTELRTADDHAQAERVAAFFARFQRRELEGLPKPFVTAEEVVAIFLHDLDYFLTQDLAEMLHPVAPPTGPVYLLPDNLPRCYVPRPTALAQIKETLQRQDATVGIVAAAAVTGMGGLGKTVLARAVCQEARVDDAWRQRYFPDGVLWATIGKDATDTTLNREQRAWIAKLGGDASKATTLDQGRELLQIMLEQLAMLLVLDDVWDARQTTPFTVRGDRLRTLITTRDATQASDAERISLNVMDRAESLALLARTAGHDMPPAEADAIAERVGDLPLSLGIIGGRLADGIAWPTLRDQLDQRRLERLRDDTNQTLFDVMAVSVGYLSPEEQQRYHELAIFPPDLVLTPAVVQRLWEAMGGTAYDRLATEELLARLRKKSLLQAENVLHDLQYDYLQATATPEQRRAWHDALIATYGPATVWGTLPDDAGGYAWRWLAWHLGQAKRLADLRTLLLNATYLRNKITRLTIVALLSDCALLPADPTITLLGQALRLSAHILNATPAEIMNQIPGRTGTQILLHTPPPRPEPHLRLLFPTLAQAGGTLRQVFPVGSSVLACVYSPNGRYVVSGGAADGTAQVWEVSSGQVVQTFIGHTRWVNACAYSPDGRYVVTGSWDRTVRVWKVGSRQTIQTFIGHTGSVNACGYSPDGEHVVSGADDGTMRVWEVISGQAVQTFNGHTGSVNACGYSPDGRYVVSGSNDGTVRVWEVSTGQVVQTFTGHTNSVRACAYSPDGRYVVSGAGDTGSNDGTVQVWEVSSGQTVQMFTNYTSWVNACAYSPDGRYVVTGASDNTVRVWEAGSGQEVQKFNGHTKSVNACTYSPDGHYVVNGSYDGTMRVWEISSGQGAQTFAGHASDAYACDYSPDGKHVVTGMSDGTVRVWEVSSGQIVQTFTGHSSFVDACAYSPDGHYVVSGSNDGTMRVWEVLSGQAVRIFTDYAGPCAYSPDGRYMVIGSWGNTVQVWEVSSGQTVQTFTGYTGSVNACAYSPDGRYVVTGSNDGAVRVWEVSSGQAMQTFIGHTDWVNACAYSPDGRYVVTGASDNTVRVWEAGSGQTVQTFTGHTKSVRACAYSPDGRYVVSGSNDGTVRVWDVSSGRQVLVWQADSPISATALAIDGLHVAAGDAGGAVHLLAIEHVVMGPAIPPPAIVPVQLTVIQPPAPVPPPTPQQDERRRSWWRLGR